MSRVRKNAGDNAPLLGLADVFADTVWRNFIAGIQAHRAPKKPARNKREAAMRH
jgi:hypothetical protein